MKTLKHSIFLIILIVLFIPASMSSFTVFYKVTGTGTVENSDYVNSTFYDSGDKIGYYSDWCKKNNYGGRKQGTEEEKISACLDAEMRVDFIAPVFADLMFYIGIFFIFIFLIILFFYVKWLKKNYFQKTA